MPGDLTTTSQCLSAARPLSAVANTWRPSTSPGGGRSSTSTGSTPSVRSRARLAAPSTPRPQTPTRAPRRSDQQILGRIAVRDEVIAHRAAAAWRRRAGRAVRRPRRPVPGAAPVPARSGRCAASSTAARHSPTSPTHSHGLLSGSVPSSARNFGASDSAGSGSASGSRPPKMALSSAAGRNGARIRSMKQHLSQRPHQWSSRVASSRWKARLQLRNVPWYWVSPANRSATHSSLNGRSDGEVADRGRRMRPRPAPRGTRPRRSALLEYWWLTGRPSTSSVGMDADHSFDMTTASRPSSTAARTAMADRIPVTGTCPFRKPELARAQQLRVDLAAGPHDGQPGDRGRRLDGVEPARRAGS